MLDGFFLATRGPSGWRYWVIVTVEIESEYRSVGVPERPLVSIAHARSGVSPFVPKRVDHHRFIAIPFDPNPKHVAVKINVAIDSSALASDSIKRPD
jgi:hypothetical protein